jgi:O-antigen/teichoic acid export membrane protein
MSILLGGVFFVGYFGHATIFGWVGWATIVIALIFLGYGFYMHSKSKNILSRILNRGKS